MCIFVINVMADLEGGGGRGPTPKNKENIGFLTILVQVP